MTGLHSGVGSKLTQVVLAGTVRLIWLGPTSFAYKIEKYCIRTTVNSKLGECQNMNVKIFVKIDRMREKREKLCLIPEA